MMYQPKHFSAKELVDRSYYSRFGERAVEFIDGRILRIVDAVRDLFGVPVYVNDWPFEGDIQYRGLRSFYCNVGALYSMHKYGRAIDFVVQGVPSFQVRDSIIKEYRLRRSPFVHIRRMEVFTGWVHVDLKENAERDFTFFAADGRVWSMEQFFREFETT